MKPSYSNPLPKAVDVQLTTDTAIYASGDVLVIPTAVPLIDATPAGPVKAYIDQITLVDQDVQNGDLDLVFMDSNTTLGAINTAVSLTDAGAKTIIRTVSIAAANYVTVTSAGNSVVNVSLSVPIFVQSAAGSGSIYVAAISRAAKTYTASGLYLRLGMRLVSDGN